MKSNLISCAINSLNEEKNIKKCLESVRWVDEIVVADMGSTDKTLEIASKYTSKIYQIPYTRIAEPGRNFTLDKCSYEWILIIDCDEEISDINGEAIRKLVKNESIDAYRFPRRQYISDNKYLRYGYFYPDYQTRLIRNNPKYRYIGHIHEQIKVEERKLAVINDIYIKHNESRSKYKSFKSLILFKTYIDIESDILCKKSLLEIVNSIIIDCPKHFYRSFIKLKGYKDGYSGFRASVIFSIYHLLNNLLGLLKKISGRNNY